MKRLPKVGRIVFALVILNEIRGLIVAGMIVSAWLKLAH